MSGAIAKQVFHKSMALNVRHRNCINSERKAFSVAFRVSTFGTHLNVTDVVGRAPFLKGALSIFVLSNPPLYTTRHSYSGRTSY